MAQDRPTRPRSPQTSDDAVIETHRIIGIRAWTIPTPKRRNTVASRTLKGYSTRYLVMSSVPHRPSTIRFRAFTRLKPSSVNGE